MKILVTGANGQLGCELQDASRNTKDVEFIFTDVAELDITKEKEVLDFFRNHDISYCINCAAYTAVDKAETERELCNRINVLGAENLAKGCQQAGATLLQISTDFVFDGTSNTPLQEDHPTNPVNYYGASKLSAEQVIRNITEKYLIIRTSWLYSIHGGNFIKTMLRLSEDRDELNVIVDQIGTPTYASDLADALLKMIETPVEGVVYGVYHFSNEGVASWYDFATAIFEYKKTRTKTNPIPTSSYPTPARRPHYSVMDKTKIREVFHLKIPHWRESLKTCLNKL